MKVQQVLTLVLAVLALLWLGGWALGLLRHMVFLAVRVAVLLVAIVVIIQLATSRRG